MLVIARPSELTICGKYDLLKIWGYKSSQSEIKSRLLSIVSPVQFLH